EKLVHVGVQHLGELADCLLAREGGEIYFVVLDLREIGEVDPDLGGDGSLAQALGLAEFPNLLAERLWHPVSPCLSSLFSIGYLQLCGNTYSSVTRKRPLARRISTRRPAASANGSPSIETVVGTVRALWTAVEEAGEAEKAKLRRDISQTVNRLKNRVESRLGKPIARARERLLFDDQDGQ